MLRNSVYSASASSLHVLFIHGFPSLAYSWRHQLAACPLPAAAFDLKGFGQSDKKKATESYSQRSLTNDVLLLLDALGWTRVIVVGHDWGGVVAWNVALTQVRLLNTGNCVFFDLLLRCVATTHHLKLLLPSVQAIMQIIS